MQRKDHLAETDRVLEGQDTGPDAVAAENWRRCAERSGLKPGRDAPTHIVTASQLREHREQSERLIATARSGLHALFRQVAGRNHVLLSSDAKGVCVEFFGDARFEDKLAQASLQLEQGASGATAWGQPLDHSAPHPPGRTDAALILRAQRRAAPPSHLREHARKTAVRRAPQSASLGGGGPHDA